MQITDPGICGNNAVFDAVITSTNSDPILGLWEDVKIGFQLCEADALDAARAEVMEVQQAKEACQAKFQQMRVKKMVQDEAVRTIMKSMDRMKQIQDLATDPEVVPVFTDPLESLPADVVANVIPNEVKMKVLAAVAKMQMAKERAQRRSCLLYTSDAADE